MYLYIKLSTELVQEAKFVDIARKGQSKITLNRFRNISLNRLTQIGVTTKMSMEDDENEHEVDDLDEDGWEEDSEDDSR